MAKECPFRMARTSSTRKRRMRGIGVKRFASVPSPAPSARPLPQAGEATSVRSDSERSTRSRARRGRTATPISNRAESGRSRDEQSSDRRDRNPVAQIPRSRFRPSAHASMTSVAPAPIRIAYTTRSIVTFMHHSSRFSAARASRGRRSASRPHRSALHRCAHRDRKRRGPPRRFARACARRFR